MIVEFGSATLLGTLLHVWCKYTVMFFALRDAILKQLNCSVIWIQIAEQKWTSATQK
jgi:hypothetical protein